jgi:hypothetical protein
MMTDWTTVGSETLAWAHNAFEMETSDLLDDPFGVVIDQPFPEYIAQRRRIAEDLGLDFDKICKVHGSDYELERLRKLEKPDG